MLIKHRIIILGSGVWTTSNSEDIPGVLGPTTKFG
jgi:hypothetical protein